MYLVTADEMRKMDEHTIFSLGIPAVALMENAGCQVAREVEAFSRTMMPSRSQGAPHWAILVGKGNNGGDGLVAARHLIDSGIEVTVVYAQDPDTLVGEAAIQRDAARKLGIRQAVYGADPIEWGRFDGIVDALLGTGSSGAPRGQVASLIRDANQSGLPILSVDIPSGLDPDTGQIHEPCIKAAKTVALAFLKRGLAQYPGREMAGEITVANIGIPRQLAERFQVAVHLLTPQVFEQRFGLDTTLPRRPDTHKGTYGHLLVCAGSQAMSGAGILACRAALRAGCGLVTWAAPATLMPSLIGHVPEAMLLGIQEGWTYPQAVERLLAAIRQRQAAVIGPGLGRFPGDTAWLRTLWEQTDTPLLLDADALNMLADAADFAAWPQRTAPVVLTPHPGEMARLCGVSTAEIQRNRIEVARHFAQKHRVLLVLKGAATVIASPDGDAYVNPTGNPGMATGGSGDVLAGIIGSLLAQGYEAKAAACLGVWLHGAAGDRAAAGRKGMFSLIAGDLIEAL
ncbi:NAD(P)H-hydrate dehydratase [Brevibacillus sp. SYP-B805]|uniref:NAD(P)H-hydrate dehydratase n=1 Tax=Brevibacillus sp. SYP-B805 TaxID=1578199 RepID=UPI0013EC6050|nr:NAD(P)H-hydrate dehydratase [Brevibacillus sp. SYP-B805]NGQ95864.1 NAD(P)H-hydrate dehydratase [Brevibacillus sp. SYP-B805]